VIALGAGRVEYGAIRQIGSAALMVGWRYRACLQAGYGRSRFSLVDGPNG
jgi:hypothetical protein